MKAIPYTDAQWMKSKEFYEDALMQLKNTITDSHSYEEIKRIFAEAQVPLFQTLHPNLNTWFQKLYRVRKVNKFNSDVKRVDSFGPPPVNHTERGRANIAEFPVGYFSILPQTALLESKVKRGEEVYMSVWSATTKNISGRIFLDETVLPEQWKKAIATYEKQLNKKLFCYNKEIYEASHFLDKSFSKCFLDKKHTLSSFLGHRYLYDTNLEEYGYSIDCILYPSVKDFFKGFNIAFSINGMKKIKLQIVLKAIVDDVSEDGVFFSLIEVGVTVKETVIWKSACELFSK